MSRAFAVCAVFTACAAGPGASAPSAPLVGPVTAIVATSHGTFACSQAGLARLLPDGTAIAAYDPGFRMTALCADARGAVLLGAGGIPGESGIVVRLRLDADGDCAEVRRAEIASDMVACIAVDPGDGSILCGCDDGRVIALDPRTLAPHAELRRHGAPVRALAWSNGLLASVALDGNLMLGSREASPLILQDHTAGIECAAWSPDGQVLATGSRDGRVRFHDRDGRLLASSEPLNAQILCAIALADGSFAFGDDHGGVWTSAAERGAPAPRGPILAMTRVRDPIHAIGPANHGLWLAGTGHITSVVR